MSPERPECAADIRLCRMPEGAAPGMLGSCWRHLWISNTFRWLVASVIGDCVGILFISGCSAWCMGVVGRVSVYEASIGRISLSGNGACLDGSVPGGWLDRGGVCGYCLSAVARSGESGCETDPWLISLDRVCLSDCTSFITESAMALGGSCEFAQSPVWKVSWVLLSWRCE
jgi:hypothetical protein